MKQVWAAGLLYGHWGYVLFYSVAWSSFVFVLIRPRMFRELGVFALFALFLIAEFTELYGLPLSINLVSRWLAFYPQTELFSRRSGSSGGSCSGRLRRLRLEGSTRTILGAVC